MWAKIRIMGNRAFHLRQPLARMTPPDGPPEWLQPFPFAQAHPPDGAAPDENAMFAGLARKLCAQPDAPALLGTDLPLLASRAAAVHSYRHAYGSPAGVPGSGAVAPTGGPSARGMAITDPLAKPAGPVPPVDAQAGKHVNLKRRKVNANRFRARPNKPPE